MPRTLTPEEALKVNAIIADELAGTRDLGFILYKLQYIFRAKGWPWPTA